MDPSALRQLLAVLREGGATSADFHPDGILRSVALGTAPPSGDFATKAPPLFSGDDGDLPPGAYDAVARAKREGK